MAAIEHDVQAPEAASAADADKGAGATSGSIPSAPATPDNSASDPLDVVPSPGDPDTAGAAPSMPQTIVIQCPNCSSPIPLTNETEILVPPPSSHFVTCPECDGTLVVQTGARTGDSVTIACDVCQGKGFVDSRTGAAVGTPAGMTPPWDGAQWDAERGLWV